LTPATTIGRPHWRVSSAAFSASTRATDAPTVPSPAIPTRNASLMPPAFLLRLSISTVRALPPRLERDDVVERVGRGAQEALDVARGLADAVLVLHQRQPDIVIAMLAEADARRDGDVGLLDQQ